MPHPCLGFWEAYADNLNAHLDGLDPVVYPSGWACRSDTATDHGSLFALYQTLCHALLIESPVCNTNSPDGSTPGVGIAGLANKVRQGLLADCADAAQTQFHAGCQTTDWLHSPGVQNGAAPKALATWERVRDALDSMPLLGPPIFFRAPGKGKGGCCCCCRCCCCSGRGCGCGGGGGGGGGGGLGPIPHPGHPGQGRAARASRGRPKTSKKTRR